MSKNQQVKKFIESLSDQDLNDDELLAKSNEFFSENCSEVDAEFVDRIFLSKKEGLSFGIELMEEYAYKGSPAAQLAIGALKLEGKGVVKNVSEAIFWLKRSFQGKNPKSGLLLFSTYYNGIGVSENKIKACQYLKGSAEMGVPEAQYYYACMLLEGEDGEIDKDLAIDYMFLAANSGYEDAITFLKENELIDT